MMSRRINSFFSGLNLTCIILICVVLINDYAAINNDLGDCLFYVCTLIINCGCYVYYGGFDG